MKFSFIMQNYCIMSGSANQLISFNVFYDVIRYFPGVKMPAMGRDVCSLSPLPAFFCGGTFPCYFTRRRVISRGGGSSFSCLSG